MQIEEEEEALNNHVCIFSLSRCHILIGIIKMRRTEKTRCD